MYIVWNFVDKSDPPPDKYRHLNNTIKSCQIINELVLLTHHKTGVQRVDCLSFYKST